jgi:predicted XRE-type DNA-binding protein
MNERKRKKLEAAGWIFGSTVDFLRLTPEETAFIEMKLAMSRCLREWRTRRRLTQTQLATKLGSSQSRVAKMEAGDPSVSVDLLARSLFKLGARSKHIAHAIV